MPITHLPYGVQGAPMIGGSVMDYFSGSAAKNTKTASGQNIFFVDGDNGNDKNDGLSPDTAVATIGQAVSVVQAGGTVYIKARKIAAGGTDPVSYAETVIIGPALAGVRLIGVANGLGQGAQPQIKKGSGSTAMLEIRAPGVLVYNLSINCVGSTASGILLSDDGSTMTAFGTIIRECTFKSNQTKSNIGAAIAVGTNGGAWQCYIGHNHFVDCVTGITVLGAGQVFVKNWLIEDCIFDAFAASDIDADINFNVSGNTAPDIIIRNCDFCCVDVPSVASGHTDLYLDMTGVTNSAFIGCRFACTGKTFGASGNAAKIPTTMRIAGCYQEIGAGANATGEIGRS